MHGAGFQGRAEIARLLMAHGVDAWASLTLLSLPLVTILSLSLSLSLSLAPSLSRSLALARALSLSVLCSLLLYTRRFSSQDVHSDGHAPMQRACWGSCRACAWKPL